jgi:hypothetical protein
MLEAKLRDYAKNKRRLKDGLPLKERTKSDYLAQIELFWVPQTGAKHGAVSFIRLLTSRWRV